MRLHFDEIELQSLAALSPPSTSSHTGTTSITQPCRTFDILLNNDPVILGYNIANAAGATFTATFLDYLLVTKPVDSTLTISLAPSVNSDECYGPAIAGIEVMKVLNTARFSLIPSLGSQMLAPAPAPAPGVSSTQLENVNDAHILYALKATLGDPVAFASWAGDLPCQSAIPWAGVGCSSSGSVIALILQHLGLAGSLFAGLGSLSALKVLWLDGNLLTGPIPPEFGALSELFSLRLHNNSLTGSVPVELAKLTNLHELTLDNNNLSGRTQSRPCTAKVLKSTVC